LVISLQFPLSHFIKASNKVILLELFSDLLSTFKINIFRAKVKPRFPLLFCSTDYRQTDEGRHGGVRTLLPLHLSGRGASLAQLLWYGFLSLSDTRTISHTHAHFLFYSISFDTHINTHTYTHVLPHSRFLLFSFLSLLPSHTFTHSHTHTHTFALTGSSR
jgi:hypothetical protein